VQHVHRLLSQVLSSAVKARILRLSPMAAVQTTPKVRREEIKILDDGQLAAMLTHLKGRDLYMPVLAAASTGMRRSEILALRWADVDLDRATLQVAQVAEQTKACFTIEDPKTDRSRRAIALPARFVTALRLHRSEQAAHRLRLGMGKSAVDLVFPAWTGDMRSPRAFSKAFAAEMKAAGLDVTFHGLRHTHITHLLRSGVPVHVVSARAGHANPTVTLNIYAHLLPGQQEGAAAVVDAALRAALED
jgi:integrase